VALWWTFFGDPRRPDPFHEALTPILRRLAPELLDNPDTSGQDIPRPYALDVEARISEIERSGHFGPAYHETVAWTGRHSAAQVRALFGSYSPWLALPPDRRAVVLDALEHLAEENFDGVVERPYLTPIYIAPRSAERR
jgi:hypothetical protein